LSYLHLRRFILFSMSHSSKPSVKSTDLVSQSLPHVHVDVQVPVLVLERRSVSHGGHHVAQVKVRWSNCDEALDTWGDEVALRQRFLSAFRPRGIPGPTSKLSPRVPAQMGRRETEHGGGKQGDRRKGETRGLRVRPAPRSGALVVGGYKRPRGREREACTRRPVLSAQPTLS
jgi:hypothetical protein